MSLFPWFPFTNFHELNLDWILQKIRGYDDRITETNARQDEIEQMLDNVEDTIEATAREVVTDAIQDGAFADQMQQLIDPIETEITEINSDISDLSSRVDDAENALDEFQQSTFPDLKTELETIVNNAQKRFKDMTVLFVGGSYSTDEAGSNYSFVERIRAAGIFKEIYTAASGGTGFTGKQAGSGIGNGQEGDSRRKWLTITQNWIDSHPKTTPKINAVYIIGGFNDVYSDYTQIRSAISEYAESIIPQMPNADFYLGFLAWCGKSHSSQGRLAAQFSGMIQVPNSSPYQFAKSSYLRRRLARFVEPAYSGCSVYGIKYLGNLNGALHNYYLDFLADGYHPSTQGQVNIAKMVINKICGEGPFVDQYNTIECHYNQNYQSTAGIAIPPEDVQLQLGIGTCSENGIYFNPIVDGTTGQYFKFTALDDVDSSNASQNQYQLIIDSEDRACILPSRELAIPCFIRGTFSGDNSTTGIMGFIRIFQGVLTQPDFYMASDTIKAKTDITTDMMDCRVGVAIVPLGGAIMQAGNTYNVRMLDTFLPYDAC